MRGGAHNTKLLSLQPSDAPPWAVSPLIRAPVTCRTRAAGSQEVAKLRALGTPAPEEHPGTRGMSDAPRDVAEVLFLGTGACCPETGTPQVGVWPPCSRPKAVRKIGS